MTEVAPPIESQDERLARLRNRRRPAVAAKVLATGLATSGFAGTIGFLASREATPSQAASTPPPPPADAAGDAAPVVQVTETVHRTVYVDEFGNEITPPTLPAVGLAGPVSAAGIAAHGNPSAPTPTLAPTIPADTTTETDVTMAADPPAAVIVTLPPVTPATTKGSGTHATAPAQQPVVTAAPAAPADPATTIASGPVETVAPATEPPPTAAPPPPPTTAAPVETAPPTTAAPPPPPPPPPTAAPPILTAPPGPPACQGTTCPP